MTAPEQASTRIVAVVGALFLLVVVLLLVRKRRLRAEYTPIWVIVAVGVVLGSLWKPWLIWLTRAIGAWTPSSTIFFLGEVFLVAICLNYAVRLSSLKERVKVLSQEVALLRNELEGRDAPAGETE